MCDIMTAAAVAGALGTAASVKGQYDTNQANQQARDDAMAARLQAQRQEQARQEGYSREQRAVAAGTQQAAAPEALAQAENQAADTRFAAATSAATPAGGIDERLRPTAGANPTVVADGAMQLSKALGEARTRLKAQSFLGGAGDAAQGLQQRFGQDNSQIDTWGGIRQASRGLYQQEAGVTPEAPDPSMLGAAGSALQGAGALGMSYAGRQQGKADATAYQQTGALPARGWLQ